VLGYTAKVIPDVLRRNYFYIVVVSVALREVLSVYSALVELRAELLAEPLVELRVELRREPPA
jgi:hypothetical protein